VEIADCRSMNSHPLRLISDNLVDVAAPRFTVTASATVNVEGLTVVSSVCAAQIDGMPPLLLQAVVAKGEKTSDGQLILAVTLPWVDIINALQKDPQLAFQISPRKWEEIIAGAYKRAKFDEVILTPHSGDHGRDVIAIKKGIGQIRIIDQVKAFKAGNLVTADDVRSLLGVLEGDGASKGFLTTTSEFAPKLREDNINPTIHPVSS
jgi:restriction system protein